MKLQNKEKCQQCMYYLSLANQCASQGYNSLKTHYYLYTEKEQLKDMIAYTRKKNSYIEKVQYEIL